ncbi:SanA/YdcF family protein [Streptomyces sp. 4N509B]|uniref:SanA/YdcF family protein n=1 Tax=Streptomyces sp. 4N509B TaxID=3457413 RepID=UPI003FD65A98
MLTSVLALLPYTWVYVTSSDRIRSVEDAPSAPVAIVFGAGVRPDGQPTRWLEHRLDAAAELYHAGRVRALLVTGDNSTREYNEPDAMRRHLLAAGVPSRHIVADYAGFSTWDSCARAHQVFGVRQALLVSQDFHIPRALALCEAAGIDAWGVGVPEWTSGIYVYSVVREMAAATTAVWDVFTTPAPRFAGPPETSLERALEAEEGTDTVPDGETDRETGRGADRETDRN